MKEHITVGRLPDNDVVIPLDMVSGRHARVEREGNRVFIVDLGSKNGVSLNDPLNKVRRAAIGPSDVVYLGTHRLAAAELLAALPEQETSSVEAHRATRFEATPRKDLAVKSQLEPNRDTPPASGASRFDYFRSPRAWAIGVALSAVLLICAVGANALFSSKPINTDPFKKAKDDFRSKHSGARPSQAPSAATP